jgi:spermidine synthase
MALLEVLNRAAHDDFTEGGDPERRRRKLAITVSGVAFSALMLELLLTRMLPFFLGNISAFLAIPVAMFGLSLGALALHWTRGEPSPSWLPLLVPLLGVVTGLALVGEFVLFNEVFNLTPHWDQNPRHDALKTVVLATIFVPSFAVAGLILSIAFTAGARHVGRLYALDLIGSAGACLVTPVLLWAVDLRFAVVGLIAVLALVNGAVFSAGGPKLKAALAAGVVALVVLAGTGTLFVARPDAGVLGGRYTDDNAVEEIRHGWNHVSRVGLLRFTKPSGKRFWWVVHDDGISNVRVLKFEQRYVESGGRRGPWAQRIPFLMDDAPRKAMVMFAGCGKDMVQMYEYAGGDLEVTGVEINGIVRRLVTTEADTWGLRAFLERPGVDLRTAEGRGFLSSDDELYDAIFVATNGAQNASRTGHARKFLDTHEAMESYLDHLAPGGVIVFNNQSVHQKVESFKRLLDERGERPFHESAALLGKTRDRSRAIDVLVVKPSGLSRDEVRRLAKAYPAPKKKGQRTKKRWLKFAPGHDGDDAITAMATTPADPDLFVPTDDLPYERRVDWSAFELFPEDEAFEKVTYSLDWIKVFTFGFFTLLSALVVVAFQVRRRGERRLPLWLGGYFGITGVCYMTAQIGLMAKLELFMGRPLYAISVVLAAFLLANGLGSAWVGRQQEQGGRPGVPMLALAAAGGVVLTLVLADGVLVHLLAWPVPVKALLAFVALAPLAFVLGCFYPVGVSLAVERGMDAQVPMTFGLATLSSVLGSTYAMVQVINVGFRAMVAHALVGYLALALIAWIAARVSSRR